jgi:hypothetical protein
MRQALLCLVLNFAAWAGQRPQPNPQPALIGQIQRRMAENLARLPNYTCLETIDRTVVRQTKKKLLLRDRIHVEVAFIEAKEMFSWPGSADFEPDLLHQIASAGASGIGGFGGWTRAFFGPSGPNFTYAAECLVEGRRGFRYDFDVPLLSSNFALVFEGRETKLPYTASLCVDPDSLEIMLLSIHAGQTPPPVTATSETIRYGHTHIGSADFLLPQDHELVVTDLAGNESRNLTRFTACREYTTQSSITFDTERTASDAERTAAPVRQTKAEELQIPAGVSLHLKLDTPITFEGSAIGDRITARLERAINAPGVTIPKGAVVSGRVRGLEQYFEPEKYFLVSLEFSSLTFEGRRGLFHARLVGPRRPAERHLDSSGMAMESATSTPGSVPAEPSGLDIDDSAPDSGAFRVRGSSLRLSRGLEIILETRSQ